ncbi:histone-like nucleoid-structuring protein Lsr2 [Bogoriella caseilytica]|uniref:Lsr2 protein n=1 Tax=Bogoriella caseilytica TaxID=56055 RepID=A0A3N2BDW2_9MICO|nr:Lsr2 family protein [Bogoriella caseilytica]ROR73224.1 Lsr2 protein [Bogoriella caseilytica]
MAQKVQIQLIDDVDGTPAVETITFGLDGVSYEIDVNEKHAGELREALSTWVGHARRSGGRRTTGRRGARAAGGSASDAGKIRDWAKSNGYKVSERGRIPADIREAYAKANG